MCEDLSAIDWIVSPMRLSFEQRDNNAKQNSKAEITSTKKRVPQFIKHIKSGLVFRFFLKKIKNRTNWFYYIYYITHLIF